MAFRFVCVVVGGVHAVDALKINQTSASNPFDCYEGKGSDYNGLRNMAASGRSCMNWLDKKGSPYGSNVKGLGNHNFCRNPQGSKEKPWCYTVDPKMESEECLVPKCPEKKADPKPWVAPKGAKSKDDEPCEYDPPKGPGYKLHEDGKGCMAHRGATWWLITHEKYSYDKLEDCKEKCESLPGTEFFVYQDEKWHEDDAGEKIWGHNCGCYRECITEPISHNGKSYELMPSSWLRRGIKQNTGL